MKTYANVGNPQPVAIARVTMIGLCTGLNCFSRWFIDAADAIQDTSSSKSISLVRGPLSTGVLAVFER